MAIDDDIDFDLYSWEQREIIALRRRVQRLHRRMKQMHEWLVCNDPGKEDEMRGWFDPHGEPL